MPNMEAIVRPFQTIRRDPTRQGTSRLVVQTGPNVKPKENVKLAFGKAGGGVQTVSGSFSLDATWYSDKVEQEVDTSGST